MQLILRANGQNAVMDMLRAGDQEVRVGNESYRPSRLARRVQKLANQMWGTAVTPTLLNERLIFEAYDSNRATARWSDSGSFTPANGATVALGRWNEDATVGIALHELAHEMHLREGGYDYSENIIREALAILAEREAGLIRGFEREPYYTASNLVAQLCDLRSFSKLPFKKRWEEIATLTNDMGLADLVNYYLDKDERIGLRRWLNQFSDNADRRDMLLNALSACSLRYSLEYRRTLLQHLVKSDPATPIEDLGKAIDAVMMLDRRYPEDDLNKIIAHCFAPIARPKRGLLAFGS
jgi:hypothetical protein